MILMEIIEFSFRFTVERDFLSVDCIFSSLRKHYCINHISYWQVLQFSIFPTE